MRDKGFTLIELLIAVTIVGALVFLALFSFNPQIAKGRDARRKADLAKMQKVLEDYLNDKICYPDTLVCGQSFSPYLTSVPCDPINDGKKHIYFYSVSNRDACKKWYKIYTTLDNKADPIIQKCTQAACGSFNYVVGSPNANLSALMEDENPPQ
jgi:prepilin-type N-terminal cleavage/methylation domain-containing protein